MWCLVRVCHEYANIDCCCGLTRARCRALVVTDARNNLRSLLLAQRIKHKYLIIYFSFSIAVNKNLCFFFLFKNTFGFCLHVGLLHNEIITSVYIVVAVKQNSVAKYLHRNTAKFRPMGSEWGQVGFISTPQGSKFCYIPVAIFFRSCKMGLLSCRQTCCLIQL